MLQTSRSGSGERQENQSFVSCIAQKETAKQELESHLGELLTDRVAGRTLRRHKMLSEVQREMIAMRDLNRLMGFAEVVQLLRPLDRPDLTAQAAHQELGTGAAKHNSVVRGSLLRQASELWRPWKITTYDDL